MTKKLCHCGSGVAWDSATEDEKKTWAQWDEKEESSYWRGMAEHFCTWCWSVRCDAYPGACRNKD